MRLVQIVIAAVVLAAACLSQGAATSAEPSSDTAIYKHLLESKSPALVTLKLVLAFDGGGGENEHQAEVSALMVGADGLVLCSNYDLGGLAAMWGRTVTPRNIKVLIGDDHEGLDARLVARDSELDLAWVQINDVEGKAFEAVSLEKVARPEPGERLFLMMRFGKFFDRAPFVYEFRLMGIAKKPRRLYIAALGGSGAPVFAENGDFAGFTVYQTPGKDDMDAGSQSGMERDGGVMILPGEDVAAATARARRAAEAERK